MKYERIRDRKEIEKHIKYKNLGESNVVNIKKEKEYEFYICDYCGKEIKILKKNHEMTGGIVIFPHSLTKRLSIKVVLCNKCLIPAIRELEKKEG